MILYGLSMFSLWGSLGPNWLVKPLATWNPRHVFCAVRNFIMDATKKLTPEAPVAVDRWLVWELPVFMNRTWENSEETPLSLSLTEEQKRIHEINCRITNSGQSSAPWSRESYDAWKQWTTESCEALGSEPEALEKSQHISAFYGNVS